MLTHILQQMVLGDRMPEKSSRTKAREAFFLEFAKAIRGELPDLPLMVTGGFRTRQGMEAAVAEGHCDLIGIGRPACLNPALPKNTIFNPEIQTDNAKLYARKIDAPWFMKRIAGFGVGAGIETVSSPRCRRLMSAGISAAQSKLTCNLLDLVLETDTKSWKVIN